MMRIGASGHGTPNSSHSAPAELARILRFVDVTCVLLGNRGSIGHG
jgi:hypothetical protein